MGTAATKLRRDTERRVTWSRNTPITFQEYLDIVGPDEFKELVDGVLEEMPLVQLEHEKLFVWLLRLIAGYVERNDLGIVLGSRTPVEISQLRGRMPDILFVGKERMSIVQQKAIFGAPDLVVEIVSPNDRRSQLLVRETDYRNIGVAEILFVHLPQKYVRLARRLGDDYEVTEVSRGAITLESVGNLSIRAEWMLEEPRPSIDEVLPK